jgi:hypothetical protein
MAWIIGQPHHQMGSTDDGCQVMAIVHMDLTFDPGELKMIETACNKYKKLIHK